MYYKVFILIYWYLYLASQTYKNIKNFSFKTKKDIYFNNQFTALIHSTITSLYYIYYYFSYGFMNNEGFTENGDIILYLHVIYYSIDIINCIKLNYHIYIYHHIISLIILLGLKITDNYKLFILAFFIAETTGCLINLRKTCLMKFKQFPYFLNLFVIIYYFLIRGILACYYLTIFITDLYQTFKYDLNSMINFLTILLCTLIIIVSMNWFKILVKNFLKYN